MFRKERKFMKREINVAILSVIVVLSAIALSAMPVTAADDDHPITEPGDHTVWSWAPGYGVSKAVRQVYEHLGEHPNPQMDSPSDTDNIDQSGVVIAQNGDGTLNITVKVWTKSGCTEHLKVWIDWDGDGIFEDEEQVVNHKQYYAQESTTQTFSSISIPPDAVATTYLRAALGWGHDPEPVGTWSWGDVEDYQMTLCTTGYTGEEMPEFPTIAVPIIVILAIVFLTFRRKQ